MMHPEDIENKEFRRSFRGYNEEEVDRFLIEIKDDYEALLKENESIKEKVALYENQISKYSNIENTLKETLITAQTAAEDTTSAATKKARVIVQEAELNARQIIEQANIEVIKMKTQYEELTKDFKVFKNKFLSLLEDEAKNIDEIFNDDEFKNTEAFSPKMDTSAFPNPETVRIPDFEEKNDPADLVDEFKEDSVDIDNVEFNDSGVSESTLVVEDIEKELAKKNQNK